MRLWIRRPASARAIATKKCGQGHSSTAWWTAPPAPAAASICAHATATVIRANHSGFRAGVRRSHGSSNTLAAASQGNGVARTEPAARLTSTDHASQLDSGCAADTPPLSSRAM